MMMSSDEAGVVAGGHAPRDRARMGLLDLAVLLAGHLKLLVLLPLAVGVAALCGTYLMPNVYTSRTVLLPPQQPQSAAAAAIAQLGTLSGLAGAAAGIKSPADLYLSLLQSNRVQDNLVDRFDLMAVYDNEYRFQARRDLAANTRIVLGNKDGLITIEVDDTDRQRAADVANQYVEELRKVSSELTLTEAQQRRQFYETELQRARQRLTAAQQALGATGFTEGALRADAKVAAEGYASLRADVTTAEVRLQTLRHSLTGNAPEVQQAAAELAALRSQLLRLQHADTTRDDSDYVSKFRNFKYEEALFNSLTQQFEFARLDEAREGALVQVIDTAKPSEWKSRPKRALIAVSATLLSAFALSLIVIARHTWRVAAADPALAGKLTALMERLRFRR